MSTLFTPAKSFNFGSGNSLNVRLAIEYYVSSSETSYDIWVTNTQVVYATTKVNSTSMTLVKNASYTFVSKDMYFIYNSQSHVSKHTLPTSNITITPNTATQNDIIGSCNYTYTIDRDTSARAVRLELWGAVRIKVDGVTHDLTFGSETSPSNSIVISIPALTSYTVTLNANGGTNQVNSFTKYFGITANFPNSPNLPTRSNYSFRGWGTTASSTSPTYSAGSAYTANSSATFYALWSRNLQLYFRANGGSGGPSDTSQVIWNATTSASFNISSTRPTRTGYNFLGWSTSSTATSASYQPGDRITISTNTTLYAVWSIHKTTFTTSVNSSTMGSASGSGTYNYGSTIKLTATPNTGYHFVNWSFTRTNPTPATDAGSSTLNPWSVVFSSSGTQYADGSVYTALATFAPNTYTVTLNANGGEGGTSSVTATYTAAMPSATMPTRNGYTFVGYYDTNGTTGGTQYYTASGEYARTWNKTTDTILYARWTPNDYTITAYSNGGTFSSTSGWRITSGGASATKQVTYLTKYGTLPNISLSNYNITGWYTEPTNGELVTSETILNVYNDNTKIYPHWKSEYTAPNFKIDLITRADKESDESYNDNEGEYAKVRITYTRATKGGDIESYTLQLQYNTSRDTSTGWIDVGDPIQVQTNASNELYVVGPDCSQTSSRNATFNVDTMYYFRLKAELTPDTTTEPAVTSPLYSNIDFLSTAHYTMDINRAGDAIGFFRVAPDGPASETSEYITNTIYVNGGIQFINSYREQVPVASVVIKRW